MRTQQNADTKAFRARFMASGEWLVKIVPVGPRSSADDPLYVNFVFNGPEHSVPYIDRLMAALTAALAPEAAPSVIG